MKHQRGTRAEGIAALKFTDAMKEGDPLKGKPPTLREYSKDFLEWVKTGRPEKDCVRTAKHPVDPVRRASLQINGSVLRPTWLA